MKKILSVVGASLVLAASLLVTSCGETEGDEIYMYERLSAPSVTLKAYPGVNVLTWNAVKDADGYDVYVKVGDNAEEKIGSDLTDTFFCDEADEAVSEAEGKSVSYRYRVIAKRALSGSFVSGEWSGSVSTKAKPAANGAKFSDLNSADYENEFKSDAKALSADTITVSPLITEGYATVKFPVKSYAKYSIYIANKDVPVLTSEAAAPNGTVEGAMYKNNEFVTVKLESLTAGEKNVTVTATPYYKGYEAESFVSSATIKVPALAASVGSDASAVYTSVGEEKSTARVFWKAGTLSATGETISADYYKVYRKNADGTYTDLSAKTPEKKTSGATSETTNTNAIIVTYNSTEDTSYSSGYEKAWDLYGHNDGYSVPYVSSSDGTEYYVVTFNTTTTNNDSAATYYYIDDDSITNTKVAYTYLIAVTDGTSYASEKLEATLAARSAKDISGNGAYGTPQTLDTDGIANDIKWTVTCADQLTTFKAYALTKGESEPAPNAVEFDTTTALTAVSESDKYGTSWTIYTKDRAEGRTYLLVIFSKEGYNDQVVVSSGVSVTSATVNSDNLSVSAKAYDSTKTGAPSSETKNDVIINVTDTITVASDSISNYTYTLYRTKSTVETDSTRITFKVDTADWAKVADVEMKRNDDYKSDTTSYSYVGVVTEKDLDDGVYAYKVVKTNTASKEFAVDINYVSVTAKKDAATTTIDYPPSISAVWASTDSRWIVPSRAKDDVEVTFTKDDAVYDSSTGKHKDVTAESGVTYTVWRAKKEADNYSLVYTKLGSPTVSKNSTDSTYYDSASGSYKDYSYVSSLTYTYTDSNVSTGSSYYYIVVASKTGAKDSISSDYVRGAN